MLYSKSITCLLSICLSVGEFRRQAPQIVGPEPHYVPLHSQVNLSCVATGNPQPTIQWYHDNKPIDGAVTPLYIIEELNLDTRGRYKCIATNDEGVAKSDSVFVKIKGINIISLSHSELEKD